MNKDRIVKLAILLVFAVGVWFLFRAVTQDAQVSIGDLRILEEGEEILISVRSNRSDAPSRKFAKSWTELTTYDALSGNEVGFRQVTEKTRTTPQFQLYRPVGARVWSYSPRDGVQLVDLRSNKAIYTQEQLIAKIPELAEKFQLQRDVTISDYAPPTKGLPITLHDGRNAWLDMSPALHFAPVPTATPSPAHTCGLDGGARPSCESDVCYRFQGMSESVGMLFANAPSGPFLTPGFLRLASSECALEVEQSVFILHDSAVTEPKHTILSRVSHQSGDKLWSQPISSMRSGRQKLMPYRAKQVGDSLVVLLSTPATIGLSSRKHLEVAILDLRSGQVRSKRKLAPHSD